MCSFLVKGLLRRQSAISLLKCQFFVKVTFLHLSVISTLMCHFLVYGKKNRVGVTSHFFVGVSIGVTNVFLKPIPSLVPSHATRISPSNHLHASRKSIFIREAHAKNQSINSGKLINNCPFGSDILYFSLKHFTNPVKVFLPFNTN